LEQLRRTIENISSWSHRTDFADDIDEKSFAENFSLPRSSTYRNLPALGNSPVRGSTMHTEAASRGTFNTDPFFFQTNFIPDNTSLSVRKSDNDDASCGSSSVADAEYLIEKLNRSANAVAGREVQKESLQWPDEQHARNRDLFKSRHLALQEEVRIATALQDTRDLQQKIRAKEERYGADAVRPAVERLKKELKQSEEWNKEFERIRHIKAKPQAFGAANLAATRGKTNHSRENSAPTSSLVRRCSLDTAPTTPYI
jgi:hypothetical protein